jgi:hypothetical protein
MAKLKIKDKDKLWIVYSVNVAGMTKQAAIGVIDHINKELSTFDDSVVSLIVPIREGNSHIEFYNMQKAKPTTIDKLKNLVENAELETI